ncbi:MAG: DUF305 domain-containing protein [Plectolyngbya sp. WJT66-NPBG17]|jgi:hypothetical protein|nr:DUF305 domain-containing protein [Plectolyngbya sp. WJT66-NPBG17]
MALNLLVSYPLPVYAGELSMNNALSQAMASMNAAMSTAPMTGNPDVDFAVMMISHHQGAVEMAKVELQYGTDPRLRRLAQEVIVTQQSEIALMQLTLEHLLPEQSSLSPHRSPSSSNWLSSSSNFQSSTQEEF